MTKLFKYLLLFFLSCSIVINGQDQDFEQTLEETIELSSIYPDSALVLVANLQEEAKAVGNTYNAINALLAISTIHHIAQNYTQSFDVAGEALFQAEELGDTTLMAFAYRRFGVMNYTFFQREETEKYLHRSIDFFYESNVKDPLMEVISTYFELVVASNKFLDFDAAMMYLDTCYMLSQEQGLQPAPVYLHTQKGIAHLHLGQLEEAIDTLLLAASGFEAIANVDNESMNKKGYLIVIYTHLAEAYKLNGQRQMAAEYFEKAMEIPQMTKRFDSHKSLLLEMYAAFLNKQGKYQLAYGLLFEADSLKDHQFSTKALSDDDFLKVRNNYRDKLDEKNDELELKQRSINRLKMTFVAVFVGLLLLAMFLHNRMQERKYRKEQQEAADRLRVKNKELTVSTLKLIEQEEMIEKMCVHIKEKLNDSVSRSLIASTKSRNASLWEDFNQRFMAVNVGFYDRLNAKVPGLTPSEIKMCALIRLNFRGKEMAQLMGISAASANTGRYRLRKKLNLGRDENLTSFIASI